MVRKALCRTRPHPNPAGVPYWKKNNQNLQIDCRIGVHSIEDLVVVLSHIFFGMHSLCSGYVRMILLSSQHGSLRNKLLDCDSCFPSVNVESQYLEIKVKECIAPGKRRAWTDKRCRDGCGWLLAVQGFVHSICRETDAGFVNFDTRCFAGLKRHFDSP